VAQGDGRVGAFRSERAQERFLAAYDRAFDRIWPVPRQPVDVPTAAGLTRVYRAGRPDGPPVVLLPGAGGNALGWYPYVAALGERHPLLVVDTPGEAGASRQEMPIRDGVELAEWLDELLAVLDVPAAHLVGTSYGGWIALRHAAHHPGRAASLTLVEPAGLAPLDRRFWTWLVLGGLAGLLPGRLRRRAARAVHNPTLTEPELMRALRPATAFRRRLPAALPLTDEELSRITVPTLALLGERSVLYDATAVRDRVRSLLPAWRVEVVPDAGHALVLEERGLVLERVAGFLAGVSH
jgi:pimeloyl-ACP methyl ester carboxylesterase